MYLNRDLNPSRGWNLLITDTSNDTLLTQTHRQTDCAVIINKD